MTFRAAAARVSAGVGVFTAFLAGATIWLVLHEPITIVLAVGDGDLHGLVVALGRMLARGVVRALFGI